MKTGDIGTRSVVTAKGSINLAQAAALMREKHVGSLVVLDEREPLRPIGIITDRDIVVKVVAGEVNARTVTVDEVLAGRTLAVAREDDPAVDSLRKMRRNGVRRLPVVDSRGQLVGIVALDDFLVAESESLADMVEAMGRERAREVARVR
ncbi:MAG: CBS domain-containing protein [Usitatibacter sp.]